VNRTIPTDIWSPTVFGRLNGVGTLDLRDCAEYFIGIAPTDPNSIIVTGFRVHYWVEVGDIGIGLADNIFTQIVNGNPVDVPLTAQAFVRFDSNNLIQNFDINVINEGRWGVKIGFNFSDPFVRLFLIETACTTYVQYCTGALQEYTSFQNCVDHISSLQFGTSDWALNDMGYCHYIHSVMIPYRPEVHCFHVGPTGGGRCTDTITYYTYYNDFALWDPYIAIGH